MHEKSHELKDAQAAAIVATSTILIFSAVYWTIQIQGVREMLALAYG
ncbi:MAG: hypothetical protein ACI92E_000436 [Oceanicoccus sp.]|jgi:hypothetical protein